MLATSWTPWISVVDTREPNNLNFDTKAKCLEVLKASIDGTFYADKRGFRWECSKDMPAPIK
jgi:hypothetical protein